MKNILNKILVTVFVTVSHIALANDKYIEAMKKNIETVYTAKDVATLQSGVNALDRIATAEPTKWEPLYYSAFGNVMIALREKEAVKKDQHLDLALASVVKAQIILPDDSELKALEGFVNMIRLTVDPATRGPQYAGKAMQLFGQATALNPENPRALALMSQMQFGTAQFFGSPTTEACATADKSLEKFETFKSDNPLAPQWGKSMAEDLKTQCR